MKCPKCGKELKDTAKFCAFCGSKVEIPAAEEKIEEAAAEISVKAEEIADNSTEAAEASVEAVKEEAPAEEAKKDVKAEADAIIAAMQESVMEKPESESQPDENVSKIAVEPVAEKISSVRAEDIKPAEIKKPEPVREIKPETVKQPEVKREPVKAKQSEYQPMKPVKRRGNGGKAVIAVIAAIVIIGGAAAAAYPTIIKPNSDYNTATAAMDEGRYAEAYNGFSALGSFKDSSTQASTAIYLDGKQKLNNGDYEGAIAAFSTYTYPNFKSMLTECDYRIAAQKLAEGDYEAAAAGFLALGDYNDSAEKYTETIFTYADKLAADGDFAAAKAALEPVADKIYGEITAQDKLKEYSYLELCARIDAGEADESDVRALLELDGYSDSITRFAKLCYDLGEKYSADGEYIAAAAMFANSGHDDVEARIKECFYNEANVRFTSGDNDSARNLFSVVGAYKDSAMKKNMAAAGDETDWNVECMTYTDGYNTIKFKAGETIGVSGVVGNEKSPAAAAVYVVRFNMQGNPPAAESISGMRDGSTFNVSFETTAEMSGTAEISVMLAETGKVLYKFNVEIA